jgi:hypothetical protein
MGCWGFGLMGRKGSVVRSEWEGDKKREEKESVDTHNHTTQYIIQETENVRVRGVRFVGSMDGKVRNKKGKDLDSRYLSNDIPYRRDGYRGE